MKFTDAMIRALQPAAQRYDVREADGFGVRLALQRWADHLERLVGGEAVGNVVAFR